MEYNWWIWYICKESYKETCSNNPLIFSNCGGYTYAHTYVEYIETTYGWNAVLNIIQSGDYEAFLKKPLTLQFNYASLPAKHKFHIVAARQLLSTNSQIIYS